MPEYEHNKKETSFLSRITQSFLILFSVGAFLGALLRVFGEILLGHYDKALEKIDEKTLLYLGVGAGMLLFREVKTLSWDKYKIEFDREIAKTNDRLDFATSEVEKVKQNSENVKAEAERAKAEAEKIKNEAERAQIEAENARNAAEKAKKEALLAQQTAISAQQIAMGVGKIKNDEKMRSKKSAIQAFESQNENLDPWKDKFGGSSFRNGRLLEAFVTPVQGSMDLFNVKLTVRSTREDKPLEGIVRFFLHPTFLNNTPVINVSTNSKAELNLITWGAFTVGAETDSGKTRLELDLASLEEAPELFRQR